MGLTDIVKPHRDSPQVVLFESGIMLSRSFSGQSSTVTTPGTNQASLSNVNLSSALQQQRQMWNVEPPLNIDEDPGNEDGDFQDDHNDIEHLDTEVPEESGECQDIPLSSQVNATPNPTPPDSEDDGEDEQVHEDNLVSTEMGTAFCMSIPFTNLTPRQTLKSNSFARTHKFVAFNLEPQTHIISAASISSNVPDVGLVQAADRCRGVQVALDTLNYMASEKVGLHKCTPSRQKEGAH